MSLLTLNIAGNTRGTRRRRDEVGFPDSAVSRQPKIKRRSGIAGNGGSCKNGLEHAPMPPCEIISLLAPCLLRSSPRPGSDYEGDKIDLRHGDVLVLYTDGAVEAENP